jgi:hypothetical protein
MPQNLSNLYLIDRSEKSTELSTKFKADPSNIALSTKTLPKETGAINLNNFS